MKAHRKIRAACAGHQGARSACGRLWAAVRRRGDRFDRAQARLTDHYVFPPAIVLPSASASRQRKPSVNRPTRARPQVAELAYRAFCIQPMARMPSNGKTLWPPAAPDLSVTACGAPTFPGGRPGVSPPPWVTPLLLFENAPLGCLIVRVGKHTLLV